MAGKYFEGITQSMLGWGSSSEDTEKVRAHYSKIAEDGTIEWCCKGRHGAIRNVYEIETHICEQFINFFFGSKSCRWTKDSKTGLWSVEFVHMTKVYPPPNKPWGWCGKTILFKDWQAREEANHAATRNFKPGQKVWFTHKNQDLVGIVSGVNQKTISVAVEGSGAWRVPPTQLHPA